MVLKGGKKDQFSFFFWFIISLNSNDTHRLSVNRMHSKKQGRNKSKSTILEDSFVTGVHQHESHEAVQNHIYCMKVEGVHASQKYV